MSYSQESNLDAIDNVKTSQNKKTIERSLIGYWKFMTFLNPDGSYIQNPESELGESSFIVNTTKPDIIFYDNKRYEVKSVEGEVVEQGTWNYDKKEQELYFEFDEPKYSVPLDKISPELLEKLKQSGGIIEFTENSWVITDISDSSLFILEHLPHDEFELKYVLGFYSKQKP